MPKFTPNKQNIGSKKSSFSLETIAFNLLKYCWMVIIGTLITAMAAYVVVTEKYEPKYTSSATFVVSTKGTVTSSVFTNLNAARSLAESFKYVLDSDVLMKTVCETMGITSFSGTVTSTLIEDTNILQLSVTSDSPSLTFKMINAIIDNHHIISDSVIADAVMDILMRPSVPKSPVNSMQRFNTVKKCMLIAALGIIAAIIFYSILSDKVKDDNDVDNRIDCEKLVTLDHQKSNITIRGILKKRKKRIPLITDPTTSFGYSETMRLLRTKVEYLMQKGNHKVLMVGSAADSEGKSIVAVNLALMLAKNDKRTLLIEGNMFNPSIANMLNLSIDGDLAIDEYLTSNIPVDMLPSPKAFPLVSLLACKKPLSNSSEIINSKLMAEFVEKSKRHFDYIIIDTPPMAFSSDAESIAELADAALMVIKQNASTVNRINDIIEILEGSNIDVLGCVFNDVKRIPLLESIGDGMRSGYDSYTGHGRYRFGSYGSYGRYGSYGEYSKNKRNQQSFDEEGNQ